MIGGTVGWVTWVCLSSTVWGSPRVFFLLLCGLGMQENLLFFWCWLNERKTLSSLKKSVKMESMSRRRQIQAVDLFLWFPHKDTSYLLYVWETSKREMERTVRRNLDSEWGRTWGEASSSAQKPGEKEAMHCAFNITGCGLLYWKTINIGWVYRTGGQITHTTENSRN